MTIFEYLNDLKTSKENLRNAIIAQGGDVNGTIDNYASSIRALSPEPWDGETIKNLKFVNSTNLTSLPQEIATGDWSLKVDMSNCFEYCYKLTSISFSSLPNVSNMNRCFYECNVITSITLPDLPNVTTMSGCFQYNSRLKSIVLPSLPKVENMSSCFVGCNVITSITLPDLPSITELKSCFGGCSYLEDLIIGKINPNISYSTMDWGLSRCTRLTTDSLINIINSLPEKEGENTLIMGTTNLNKLTEEQIALAKNKGWTLS